MANDLYGKLQMAPWPDIDDSVRDMAERLTNIIEVSKRASNSPASTRDEENLPELIQRLVKRIIESPHEYRDFGIQPVVIDQMVNDKGFFRGVLRATRVRASRLWPLSRVLYLRNGVEDIHCLRWDKWVVTAEGNKILLDPRTSPFHSEEEVIAFFRDRAINMVGVSGDSQLNEGHPIAQTTVGAIRMTITIAPATSGDSKVYASIRVPAASHVTELQHYVQNGVMTPEAADFLRMCVQARCNILIAGGTASGKTTLMRVLAGAISGDEIVVVIEEAAELHLEQDRRDGPRDPVTNRRMPRPWLPCSIGLNTVSSPIKDQTGITQRDLVRLSLRYRPDRILIGEARGSEMADACVAMTSGHDGSMATIHADSADEAIQKAADYILESERYRGNEDAAKRLAYRAIEVVVHLSRSYNGQRIVTGITVLGNAPGQMHTIFEYREGALVANSLRMADLPQRIIKRFRNIGVKELPLR